ncbi:transposase [Methylocaldum marinum]|uniref:Transposase n=1 Tax=Methylocaldum marinum TaxID=1432792 RepID=A0A250KP84_9GAMM|nr:transposase [Methylocaldum marinum]
MEYRCGRHTVFTIKYPFAWKTKYSDKVLVGEVAERVRDLVRQTCEMFEIRILKVVAGKTMFTFWRMHSRSWSRARS